MRLRTTRLFLAVASAALFAVPLATASAATAKHSNARQRVGAAECARNKAAGTMTFVSPFDYDASAGIIDIFAAKSLGYFSAMCIDVGVVIPSYTLSPYALVAAGRGTVTGEGSAADTLLQVVHTPNLVAISTFADVSDYALLTQPKITSLKQLAGGSLAYHTVLPVVLVEMLAHAGVNIASVHTIDDNSYDPRLLVKGKFDALQAYQSNEPLELEADGYQLGKGFREFLPSANGVQGTFNVQVVNGAFLAKHPGTVADFLRADLKATAYCLVHQAQCVSIEEAAAAAGHATFVRAHDLAEWRYESGLIEHDGLAGKGIGVQTAAEWQAEANALVHFGLVKNAPALQARNENTSIAASLYRGTTLIWP